MFRVKNLVEYGWSFLNTGGSQIIGFLATMIVARIATPSDFGVIAICSSIVLLANLFSELGLTSTIVANRTFSVEKASTIHLIVVLLSTTLFLGVFIFSDNIARLSGNELVGLVLPWMAVTILANACGSVNAAVMVRRLQFQLKMKISLASVALGSVIGVLVSYSFNPISGLVVLFTMPPVLIAIGLWIFAPYGFTRVCNPRVIYEDIPFAVKVAVSGFFEQGSRALLTFLLNARFGVVDLGFYSRADAIKNLSSQTLDKVVQRVSFPTLTREGFDSKGKLIAEHINISVLLLCTLVPVAYFVSEHSAPLILVFYGQSWDSSATILERLIYMGLFLPMTSLNLTLFKSYGMAGLMMFNRAVALALLPVVFLISDVRTIFEIIDYLVLYSIALYIISICSIALLDIWCMLKYIKGVLMWVVPVTAILAIHKSFLAVNEMNVWLAFLANGLSLVFILAVAYSGVLIFVRRTAYVEK